MTKIEFNCKTHLPNKAFTSQRNTSLYLQLHITPSHSIAAIHCIGLRDFIRGRRGRGVARQEAGGFDQGTAGRVRAKRLASRASEAPIPMHPTAPELLHPPALLRGGAIGWPLLRPALYTITVLKHVAQAILSA